MSREITIFILILYVCVCVHGCVTVFVCECDKDNQGEKDRDRDRKTQKKDIWNRERLMKIIFFCTCEIRTDNPSLAMKILNFTPILPSQKRLGWKWPMIIILKFSQPFVIRLFLYIVYAHSLRTSTHFYVFAWTTRRERERERERARERESERERELCYNTVGPD